MRHMMLDLVEFSAQLLARKRPRQAFRNSDAAATIAQPGEDQSRIWPMAQDVADLADPVGAAVLVDCDVVYIAQAQASLPQAIADRLRWKACPVFLAPKPLFL